MYYAFLTVSALLISCQFIFLKLFQKEVGATVFGAILFSLFIGFFQGLFVLILNGFRLHFTLYSALMALLFAACAIAANTLGIKVMSLGRMSIYTLFMMLGGMVIPFLWGVLFLGEKLKPIYLLALVLLVAALSFPVIERKNGEKKSSALFLVLCCILFCANGAISTVSKLHQINASSVGTRDYILLIDIAEFFLALILLPIFKKNNSPIAIIKKKKPLLYGMGFTGVSTTASLLQFYSEKFVNASILFPILTGGTIVFSAFTALLFFHEKINKYAAASIVFAFTATLLFMF